MRINAEAIALESLMEKFCCFKLKRSSVPAIPRTAAKAIKKECPESPREDSKIANKAHTDTSRILSGVDRERLICGF